MSEEHDHWHCAACGVCCDRPYDRPAVAGYPHDATMCRACRDLRASVPADAPREPGPAELAAMMGAILASPSTTHDEVVAMSLRVQQLSDALRVARDQYGRSWLALMHDCAGAPGAFSHFMVCWLVLRGLSVMASDEAAAFADLCMARLAAPQREILVTSAQHARSRGDA